MNTNKCAICAARSKSPEGALLGLLVLVRAGLSYEQIAAPIIECSVHRDALAKTMILAQREGLFDS